MKNSYECAYLIDMDVRVEGVYAASGNVNTPPVPPTPPTPPVTPPNVTVQWDSHNSGSHSDGRFYINGPGVSGESLVICCTTNFPVYNLLCSDATVTTNGEYGFTVVRNNHFNPGDCISIGFQVYSNVPEYKTEDGRPGAVGKTGDPNGTPYRCSITSVSYNQ